MHYSIAQQSLVGSRPMNQDRVAHVERDNAVLMVVADGVGGYAGGELAAETLVDTFVHVFGRIRQAEISDPAAFLVLTTVQAHTMINRRSAREGLDAAVPRTTCVACLVQNGLAYWAHVGDSRLYHFRGGRELFRTEDHSTSEQLIREGVISAGQSLDEFSQLTLCVGGTRPPRVTLGPETRLQEGDALLLCSDGVWRAYPGQGLGRHLADANLEDGTERLVAQAQQKQGHGCDNLTAIAFRWEERATRTPPRYGLSMPMIDQDNLWRTPRATDQGHTGPTTPNVDYDNFESAIAELESFVDQIDDWI